MIGHKRLQLILTEEAWALVKALSKEALHEFESGRITYSDVINEMIVSAKIDVKTLQLKHMDLRRSLKVMALKDDIDLDSAIKVLTEMKSKHSIKKSQKGIQSLGEIS